MLGSSWPQLRLRWVATVVLIVEAICLAVSRAKVSRWLLCSAKVRQSVHANPRIAIHVAAAAATSAAACVQWVARAPMQRRMCHAALSSSLVRQVCTRVDHRLVGSPRATSGTRSSSMCRTCPARTSLGVAKAGRRQPPAGSPQERGRPNRGRAATKEEGAEGVGRRPASAQGRRRRPADSGPELRRTRAAQGAGRVEGTNRLRRRPRECPPIKRKVRTRMAIGSRLG